MEKQPPKVKSQSESVFENELAKFCQIFPQFVSEGKIDFVAFQKFLQQNKAEINNQDRYNFSWAGKMQSFHAIQQPCFATLTPQKEQSVDFAKSRNLFIEGDNLEVLKLLQNNYRNQIKMIYIDPPYNTGKDFIYKDNFKQNRNDYFERIGVSNGGIKLETNSDANGRFHSDWLSMIYPRLFLAKQLLREDGVIFVSIDDNEQHHLKMLMNEIFGEENFLNIFMWLHGKGKKTKQSRTLQQYVLCYTKNKITEEWIDYKYATGDFKNPDNDPRGDWFSGSISFDENRSNSNHNNYFEIKSPSGEIWKRQWQCDNDEMQQYLEDNKIYFGSSPDYSNVPRLKIFKEDKDEIIPKNILDDCGSSRSAQKELDNVLGKKKFENPKPCQLIKHLIKIMNASEDDIILDFFAGSATTGHAVMDLNKEDGGNRQFILVQIPEKTEEKSEAYKAGYKNIAKIGIERLKRAIAKNDYKDGFKLFTLTPSNYNISQAYKGTNAKELLKQERLFSENPLVKNYQPENLVYEILLKNNFSLHSIIQQQGDFWIVTDEENEQKIYLTLANKIDEQTLKNFKLDKAKDLLICLDKILDDTLKQNLHRDYNLKII